MEIREVGVVGLGTMGAGIAEVFARAGLAVTAVEADAAALDRGIAILAGSLNRAVTRGKLTGDEQTRILGLVRPGQALTALAGADLVIEVVPEQLAVKRQVLAELDRICRPEAILATNTSSLSVTTIAAGTAYPGRVAGMHFFNPAPVMALVEVVTTVLTDQHVARAVTDLARHLGKTPVRVADRAGFVANALLLPYLNHAARLLGAGYATRDDIDAAVTVGIGLPMGPLALLDLIGIDTALAILEVLNREFGGTRYTPAPLLRRMTDAGHAGRKSGQGFYQYQGGHAETPAGQGISENAAQHPGPDVVTLIDPAAGQGPPGGADTAAAPQGDVAATLTSLITAAGISVTSDPAHPTGLVIIAIGPQGGVLGPAIGADRAADAVGLHLATPDLAELVPTPLTSAGALAAAEALVTRLGLRAVRTPDRPGLLVGALLYPHLRDAVVMVDDGYATADDVDTAMTLGCGYPRGPMRLLADAGPGRAAAVLRAMQEGYGDPSFAPPPLLLEYALAGLRLAHRP